MTETIPAPIEVGPELYHEIVQFLYHEANLLDTRRFEEWLDLLDDDVEYEMPLTLTRERGEQTRAHDYMMEFFAENIHSLKMRVARLGTDYAWAEDPPTRTRHVVANVRATRGEDEDEVKVHSIFCIFASRGDAVEYKTFVGTKDDVLARLDGRWRLRKRVVYIDQAKINAHTISFFI
jgi:3-phenylpropionate/cinnamic acid dioxygenase small subunit